MCLSVLDGDQKTLRASATFTVGRLP